MKDSRLDLDGGNKHQKCLVLGGQVKAKEGSHMNKMKPKRKRKKKKREPKIIREIKEGIYEVSSTTSRNKTYRVNILKKRCTCLGYTLVLKKTGGMCKHLRMVQDYVEGKSGKDEPSKKYEDPVWG